MPASIDFSNINLILWDFDGVIMDSMPVRDLGFREVLKNYPAQHVDALIDYHRRNGGLSRYVKFRYFFEQILGSEITEFEIKRLSQEFSVIMRKLLVNPGLLINDSLDFIKKYHRQIEMHVVSGSDHEELNFLCEKLMLALYFKSIHGSPTPKKELVRQVLAGAGSAKSQVVLIGDSLNDYEAASANSIAFLGYNNETLKSHHTCVERFVSLPEVKAMGS